MRRLFMACAACLLMVSMASAQEVQISAPGGPVANAAAAAASGSHGGHVITGGAACGVKKVCVVVPDVKKTTKTCYSCSSKDVCFPKSSLSCCCSKGCEQGGCESCVRTVRVLLKKTVTTECPSFKCVPAEAPCEASCAPSCRITGSCGKCARSGCPVGCCAKSAPAACETTIPAAPVPVNPEKKMPNSKDKGTIDAPIQAPTTSVAPTASPASLRAPLSQPMPAGYPRQ